MINFLKTEWKRLENSPLRRLIYLMVISLVLGRLAMIFPYNDIFKILFLFPIAYLIFIVFKFLIYAWIINPINNWKERKKK